MTTTTNLNANSKVGEWVAQHPRTSRVFEALQIDFCCRGRTTLEEACQDQQLNPTEVVAKLLEGIETTEAEPAEQWTQARLADLCDHIEQTHHAYLREELPRLNAMISKVVKVHSKAHAELPEIEQAFGELRAELEPHMFKEEQVLFPAIRQLEQSKTQPEFPFGTVANPIRMMEHEHDNAGNALSRIRKLTRDFTVPEGACNTYRAMLDGLSELEADLHQHIHKENNILFPRAAEREETLSRQ